jgi:protein-tyrosine kinase
MSETYKALKKAEAEKAKEHRSPLENIPVDGGEKTEIHRGMQVPSQVQEQHRSPLENIPVDGGEKTEIHHGMQVPSRVQYEKLRVWLTNPASRGQRLQTVMVVGCRSGNGSTTTAALLAATLAEGKKKRVLIIDGNFRTPSLNLVFDVKNNGGFTEVVSAGMPFEAHIQPTNRENLFVLTSGQISFSPTEVFEGEAIDQLVSWLKEKFEFIIFDSAPACEFPDCYALAPKVDSIILVTQAEETSIQDAQRAKWNLEQAGGRILGVVLNREKDYTPAFLRNFLSTAS